MEECGPIPIQRLITVCSSLIKSKFNFAMTNDFLYRRVLTVRIVLFNELFLSVLSLLRSETLDFMDHDAPNCSRLKIGLAQLCAGLNCFVTPSNSVQKNNNIWLKLINSITNKSYRVLTQASTRAWMRVLSTGDDGLLSYCTPALQTPHNVRRIPRSWGEIPRN